jgi:tape measure domain-containing protein
MPVFNISFDVSKLKSGASEATDALSGVNSEAKKVENELDKVADSGKTSGEGLKKTSSGAKEASDSFSSLSKTVKTAGGHFAAFFAIDKMVAIGKELLNVSIAVDRLNKSYQSIEGSSGGAKEQLEFIYKTSQDLGLSFMSTAESAKTFFASAKGTSLEKDMNKIFTSVSQAGTAMSLSSEQMQGVFLALGQMISKGKVQAEELRGQLGERLPGAFRIAADAMGMTIAELDKFMADGELTAEDLLPKLADALTNKFAVAAEQAATGVQQSINKMDNEWTVFKANLLDSEPVVSAINMITSALQGLNAQIGQRDLEKRMEAAGWERTEKTDFRKSTYKLYTDEQKEAFLEYEKMLRDQEKAEAEVTNNQKVEIDKRTKAASDANAAYEKIFSTTKKGQINAANEAYSTAAKLQKDALDKGAITQAEYDSRITALAQARDDKLTAINKRGSKTRLSEVEREAKKFTEATAQYDAGLKQLRNEVSAMEDALDPSLTKFERLRKQIEAEEKAAKGNADVKSEETVRRKQATAAQAQETAALEKRKATLTATQKLDELENQNLKEKADFYKDLANKTGRYSTSMEYQNQLLEKQREIWLGMGIPVNDVQEMIRQLQLESSRDPFDGITRGLQGFISKATDGAKAMEDTFSGLFNGMDSGFKDVWQQMLDDGKVSLSSFKSLFASFLADLMHMAITRPIVVQIAGVVSGMLGAGGVGASGSGYGSLLGNVPVSSLIPNSWTSGVSGILGATLPGTSLALTTPGAYTAGEILLMQGGGTTAGVSGGSAALMSSGLSLGSALMYGGLGLLGYSMLDDALGLPQSKYSGLTAGLGGALGAWGGTAAGSAAGIAAGSTLGSVIPVAGTIIGAIAGGALGSLFGQERKTHPSVYGSMMGQG